MDPVNIFLTQDYELFFGDQHGTVENSIIYPTNELIKLGDRTGAHFTFFIDIGFIIKLEESVSMFPKLKDDLSAIVSQIKSLVRKGHDCQLHIHPHWEDCRYNGTKWEINIRRYKLPDFSSDEIHEIFFKYKKALEKITGKPVTSYRAGGWCLQPFDKIRGIFLKNNIRLDSTVFKEGFYSSEHYFYDFRNCPDKTRWKFSNDLVKEDKNGEFMELPISNIRIKPLFFWQLFFLGRLQPFMHKPLGDGYPIPSPGLRKKSLTTSTNNCVSSDGYFAKLLNRALEEVIKNDNGNDLVILGHPKACTRFSLRKLEKFINTHKKKHRFLTFADISS